jgi:hypothetical protein
MVSFGILQVVTVLKEIIYEILQQFRKNRGSLPQQIIIFREGISEGQFKLVRGGGQFALDGANDCK